MKYFDSFTSGVEIQRRAARWADPDGGYLHSMRLAMWGDFTWRITGKDANGNLTKEGGWQKNLYPREIMSHANLRGMVN